MKVTSFRELKQKFNKTEKGVDAYFDEGVDHVNLVFTSKNPVAKFFSLDYRERIYYPYIGHFASVMGLWVWLKSKDHDETIRKLYGRHLREYRVNNKGNSTKRYIPNFSTIIMYANWLKVKNRPDMIEEIKKFDLNMPMFLYYTVRDSVIKGQYPISDWYVAQVKEIIKAVQEDREPDFDKFVTDRDFTGFFYTEGVLRQTIAQALIPNFESFDTADITQEMIDQIENTLAKLKTVPKKEVSLDQQSQEQGPAQEQASVQEQAPNQEA